MVNITPDKKAIYGKISAESGGFALAEMASMAVSLGVVGIADTLAPNLIKSASQAVSKTCIEPNLDTIEKTLGTVCRLKECQPDKTQSREERAEHLAKTMIVFSAAWAASMAAKVATRRIFNSAIGIEESKPPAGKLLSDYEKKILVADEGIHYGSILLMNTVGASVTDDMISSTANILEKVGFSKKKAHEISSMAVVWELPNFLGMAAGIGAIAHNKLKGASHLDKLTAIGNAASQGAHI